MKIFKLIDLGVQAILIIAGIIYGISSISRPGRNAIDFYLAVGSWQIISYSIHHFFITPTIYLQDRGYYAKILLVVLIPGIILFIPVLFGVSIIATLLILYLMALLLFTPFLAIYYFWICWKEYRLIIKRELIHLK